MILGHERAVSYLEKVLKKGDIPHAFLFWGPANIGKLTVAKEFLKTLFCEKNNAKKFESNCGACRDCAAIEANAHPEIFFLAPGQSILEGKTDKREIGLPDINEIKRKLNLAVPEGRHRAILIDGAEYLTDEAENSLLKVLEEPGPRTVFVLVAESPGALLPTIVSRSIPVRFSPVSDSVICEFLKKRQFAEKDREELIELAAGRAGLIVCAIKDSDFFIKESRKYRGIGKLLSADLIARFNYAEKISQDREETSRFLTSLYFILRRALFQSLTGQNPEFTPERLGRVIKFVDEISSVLAATNVNPRLALETLFLELES